MRIVRIARTLGVMAALWLAIAVASAAVLVKTIKVSAAGVSSDGTHVWVLGSGRTDTVTELDASTGAVVRKIKVGGSPVDVSSDGTHVWVANNGTGDVDEIDASTGTVVNRIGPFHQGVNEVASDGTHVWVTGIGNVVSEIDAATGIVVKTIRVSGPPLGVSADGTHTWVALLTNRGMVVEIDAATGTVVRTVRVPLSEFYDASVVSDGAHVWVSGGLNEVAEINAATGRVIRTINVFSTPPKGTTVGGSTTAGIRSVATGGGYAWVATSVLVYRGKFPTGTFIKQAGGAYVWEINPATGKVVQTIHVNLLSCGGLAADARHVWLATGNTVSEIKIRKR